MKSKIVIILFAIYIILSMSSCGSNTNSYETNSKEENKTTAFIDDSTSMKNENIEKNIKVEKSKIKIFGQIVSIANEDVSIKSTCLDKEDLKDKFLAFSAAMSISSVKFDYSVFKSMDFKVEEIRFINKNTGYYYCKYIDKQGDIVFMVFDQDFSPLQVIEYGDSLFNDAEKIEYNYAEKRKNMNLKSIIKKIDI